MPLLPERKSDYVIRDGRIYLTPEYLKSGKKFKKITGTRMAAVLGKSKYTSPAQVWADIVGIYKEEIDPMALEAGTRIEPVLREYLEKQWNMRFKTYDPRKINYDVFKEDDCFGGIPDGEQIDENGQFMYDRNGFILEIKTTSVDKLSYAEDSNGTLRPKRDPAGVPKVSRPRGKLLEWYPQGLSGPASVPIDYQEQVKLYMYLRKAHKAVIAVTFLEPTDYVADLSDYDPANRIVKAIGMDFKPETYEKDATYARKWYDEHVRGGVSPPLSERDLQE